MIRLLETIAILLICVALTSCDASSTSTANNATTTSTSTSSSVEKTGGDKTTATERSTETNSDADGGPTPTDKVSANDNQSTSDRNKVVDVTFNDLICNMQPDIVLRPWMLTERAQELDGKKIRVQGYMHGGVDRRTNIKEFVLLRNLECKFGPGGQADHLIRVKLGDGVTTDYAGKDVVEVVGVLKIEPFQGPDGNTWSIYDMDGEAVKRR